MLVRNIALASGLLFASTAFGYTQRMVCGPFKFYRFLSSPTYLKVYNNLQPGVLPQRGDTVFGHFDLGADPSAPWEYVSRDGAMRIVFPNRVKASEFIVKDRTSFELDRGTGVFETIRCDE